MIMRDMKIEFSDQSEVIFASIAEEIKPDVQKIANNQRLQI
jgi:hypothetical protein